MAIVFSSPDDEPYGCFHPESRYHGFWGGEHNWFWGTVTQWLLADRLASPADREKVRMAGDAAKAAELAAGMEVAPGWEARLPDVLRTAVRLSFTTNLGIRAVLLGTGDQPIEARLGDPALASLLGRVLEEVRAELRPRAEDPEAIQCRHAGEERLGLACVHLLDSRETYQRRYHRRFPGLAGFDLLCAACRVALPATPPLRKLCWDCFTAMLSGQRQEDVGEPPHRERATDLHFVHEVVTIPGLAAEQVIAHAPIARVPDAWLMLDRAGRLHRVDLRKATAEPGGVVPADALELGGAVELHAAPDGRLAAVAEARGRRAVILDPASGRITMRLLRDDYHEEHCRFPLGFFELGGRLLLVHATEWNRLDVSDPATGELLTERAPTGYRSGEARPEHYLDYFHAGLAVSPDGERVLDNGWVWQPVGVPRVFSLKRWIEENRWESEDGPSVKDLCYRTYYWDGPACWLDEGTIAIWGEGEDDLELTPGVRIFDAESGAELRSFAGPPQGLLFDPPYLVAYSIPTGTSIWDPATGERLASDPTLRPTAYHPASRELLTVLPGDGFRVSRRAGD